MKSSKKKSSGTQVKKEPVSFDWSQTVEDMAKRLIGTYHSHLVNCSIAYLFKNRPMNRGGRPIITTSEKCSPKLKALSNYDFIITVSYPNYNNLTDKQKMAAIDHALQHLFVDETDAGDVVHKILAHDVEEFSCVIERNGLYQDDLVQLGRVMAKPGSKSGTKSDPVEAAMQNDPDEEEEQDEEDDNSVSDFI